MKVHVFVLKQHEDIVRKGENDGYQDFLLISQCFQNVLFSGLLKTGDCW